ncbi:YciI family protein [Ramlibacter sp.]|uniref:YciI family protein n=1 Tax=Ramlibacter sp. TaxID=1917967 RepID=UPI00179DBC7C|nr:YciI family protein [Ramlibacter sp.]MBA2673370.1 YciI family protein [Ramlibacter sp.]
MQYMLMIYADPAGLQALRDAEQSTALAAYTAYTEALKSAGVWRAGERLRTGDTATTVRVREGKTDVLNGPFIETREQLGGYYLIEAPDLDTALSWAARCPGASHGTMEVRPVWSM